MLVAQRATISVNKTLLPLPFVPKLNTNSVPINLSVSVTQRDNSARVRKSTMFPPTKHQLTPKQA